MNRTAKATLPTLFPYLSYQDPGAALDWLAEAFGFVKLLEFRDPAGYVVHAEMGFGNGAIMLGAAVHTPTEHTRRTAPAKHGVYVYVEDVDAHCARAQAAGARIVIPPEDTEWGSRRYRALDPEGYEWSFGNYRPTPQA